MNGEPEEFSLSEQLTARVQEALSTAMHAHDGSMPTRWLVVVECMEGDGRTTMSMGNSPGMSHWEILGMAAYAHQVVQAAVIVRTIREAAE